MFILLLHYKHYKFIIIKLKRRLFRFQSPKRCEFLGPEFLETVRFFHLKFVISRLPGAPLSPQIGCFLFIGL